MSTIQKTAKIGSPSPQGTGDLIGALQCLTLALNGAIIAIA